MITILLKIFHLSELLRHGRRGLYTTSAYAVQPEHAVRHSNELCRGYKDEKRHRPASANLAM